MSWEPYFADSSDEILQAFTDPLQTLAAAEVPALVLRQAYSENDCQQLLRRLRDHGHLANHVEQVASDLSESIPEGFYRQGTRAVNHVATPPRVAQGHRFDLGTSLGYRGADQASYFAHANQSRRELADLLRGLTNPISLIYETLATLACGKEAITAREADGREYGAAIFRIHYGQYTYPPHFDSVRLREARHDYCVSQYSHQFAGVLVLQNAVAAEHTAQCIIHRCVYSPDLDAVLHERRFPEYARIHRIESTQVNLEPGDLYFFNTHCIHEVPGVNGQLPRVVLATFIGYDPTLPQIMVWG